MAVIGRHIVVIDEETCVCVCADTTPENPSTHMYTQNTFQRHVSDPRYRADVAYFLSGEITILVSGTANVYAVIFHSVGVHVDRRQTVSRRLPVRFCDRHAKANVAGVDFLRTTLGAAQVG